MLRQEIGWFDDEQNSTGALTTRLASDASRVQGVSHTHTNTHRLTIPVKKLQSLSRVVQAIHAMIFKHMNICTLGCLSEQSEHTYTHHFPLSPQATGSRLSALIEAFTAVILSLVIAFAYSWIMTLFMIGVVPVVIVGAVFQIMVLSWNITQHKKALESAGMVAVDSIENIRTVAAFGIEQNFTEQYCTRINIMYRYTVSPVRQTSLL